MNSFSGKRKEAFRKRQTYLDEIVKYCVERLVPIEDAKIEFNASFSRYQRESPQQGNEDYYDWKFRCLDYQREMTILYINKIAQERMEIKYRNQKRTGENTTG